MKKLKFVLFVFFVSSLLIAQEAQEKSGAKNINTVTKAPAKVIDAPQGAIKTNNNITVVTYDFTTSPNQYHGTTNACVDLSAAQDGSGPWGMIAGDSDQNGGIGSSDLISTRADLGSTDYNNDDVDMNGGVGSSDLILIRKNLGKTTQLP